MSDFMDRDYSAEFAVTLKWREWNRLYMMYCRAVDAKDYDAWGDDAHERDQTLGKRLNQRIGDASPGNGADDWPDSMKEAYDEAVTELLADLSEAMSGVDYYDRPRIEEAHTALLRYQAQRDAIAAERP